MLVRLCASASCHETIGLAENPHLARGVILGLVPRIRGISTFADPRDKPEYDGKTASVASTFSLADGFEGSARP
jgi:hypothetical protein